MKQYEMYIANEYTETIVDELSRITLIQFDEAILNSAIKETEKNSKNNLYVINNGDNKLIIDCNNRDYIYALIYLVEDRFAIKAREIMLKWDNKIREEYGQDLIEEEKNVFGKRNTLLENIEDYYGVFLIK